MGWATQVVEVMLWGGRGFGGVRWYFGMMGCHQGLGGSEVGLQGGGLWWWSWMARWGGGSWELTVVGL